MRRRQILAGWPITHAVPFALRRIYSFGEPAPCIAVLDVADGYFCLEYRMGEQQVVAFAVKKDQLGGIQYQLSAEGVEETLALLKKKAMLQGATPEAIRLFGALRPLTKEEEASMATNKLQAADKAGLKEAAKQAPVGGKVNSKPKAEVAKGGTTEAPKRKGNAEALAKARAERGPAPNRKYTVVNKVNGAREGSWTHHMVGVILKHKDTDSAKATLAADKSEHSGKKLDFKWAEDKGYIKLA